MDTTNRTLTVREGILPSFPATSRANNLCRLRAGNHRLLFGLDGAKIEVYAVNGMDVYE